MEVEEVSMIRVTVEIVPRGIEEKKYKIAEIDVVNIGQTSPSISQLDGIYFDYRATLYDLDLARQQVVKFSKNRLLGWGPIVLEAVHRLFPISETEEV